MSELHVSRAAMLDVWMALDGEPQDFEAWMDEPDRTTADAWAQLLAAIRGDLMVGDTNPEPGEVLGLVWKRLFGALRARRTDPPAEEEA